MNLINQTELKGHLYKLEEKLLQPSVRKSIEELDNLLADEFMEYGSSGQIFYKEIIMNRLPYETTIKMTMMDFEIKLLASNVALTTFKLLKHNNMQYSLRSSIWKLKEEKWKMIFHQGTPTTLS
ncbi:DUF4440 domain-containing protein [Priestia flexa]|uniref:nuclear transport factor 2 family protein n=1 Tax=Priestia flexa TaxID=86664 RepID=UPI003D2F144A